MVERVSFVAAALWLTVGCGPGYQEHLLANVSAPLAGCVPEEVVVGNVQRSGSRPRTWEVTCRERVWSCRNRWGRVTCD